MYCCRKPTQGEGDYSFDDIAEAYRLIRMQEASWERIVARTQAESITRAPPAWQPVPKPPYRSAVNVWPWSRSKSNLSKVGLSQTP